MTFFQSEALNIALNIAVLVFSVLFLWKGADSLVESASRIAETFGISELVIGLTIVAFGTSAPEFAVTLNAAMNKQADISVGNIVGSNIFNLGFILGAVAIAKSIKASKKLVYRDGIFMIMVTLLLLVFFYDNRLSKYEGIILMSILVVYLVFLFIKKEQLEEEDLSHIKATWKDGMLLPMSIAAVIVGGNYLVSSASFLARIAGISDWVIGITIVAAGTSAPEMATSLAAVMRGKHGMSAGNLIGSNLFNILGVLGLAGAINPMVINPKAYTSLIMLSGLVTISIIFLRTGWKITRSEGIILFMIGIAMWVMDFLK